MPIEVFHLTIDRSRATDSIRTETAMDTVDGPRKLMTCEVQPGVDINITSLYVNATFTGDLDAIKSILDSHESFAAKGLSFVKVADVDTDSLEDAFALTNHIDRPWSENGRVEPAGDGKWRSTSVGDLLRVDGQVFSVSPVGFSEVSISDPNQLDLLPVSANQPRIRP